MLDAAQFMQAAHTLTGIAAFTDADFLEGFDQLVISLNKDARLSKDSEKQVGDLLLRFLVNRLRMERDFIDHPEISEIEVLPPVVITSLPRTGSTKLHRLLAATGDFFCIETWQEYNLAPFPDAQPGKPDPRIQSAHDYIEWFRSRAPGALQAHPMAAEEVEEELLLLASTMRSPFFHQGNYDVSGFIQWVTQQDVRDTYRDLRRMLQYLQWQHHRGQAKPWVLKSPSHLGAEQAFSDVFPGSRFIVSHRDPLKVIPSVCSLMCKMREVYSDEDFTQQAGIWGTTVFPYLISNHMVWCDNNPQASVCNISYRDIRDRELDTLKSIYRFLGMPLTESALDKCKQWLIKDSKVNLSPHHYSSQDFGLTDEVISQAFQEYTRRYHDYL